MAIEFHPTSIRDLIGNPLSCAQQRPALLAPGGSPLSYPLLTQRMDCIGGALRSHGIGRADRVAVVLPNGPAMAVAFLGVASYATCAPLNPAYGAEELEFYLTDLAAKAVVTNAAAKQPVRDVAARLGLAVFEAADMASFPVTASNVPAQGKGHDVALVLHTSGTTARPKQVPLTHENLCASARHIAATLQLTTDDCCLNVMPLFHIHGLIGVLLSSLSAGGTVICTDGFQAGNFLELLRQWQPSWYSAVPTIHQAVLTVLRDEPAAMPAGRLRLIRSSSAALPPTVMAELERAFGVPVIESYGMTEAAHQMASNPLPPGERKAGSVGRPAGPEMAVMDEAGKLLAANETGEIVIRGPNVTAGYVNHPDANRAAFSEGWFRTGDLGRVDEAGYFYLTGRKKEMINRGGENISPREIDEALLQHPAVAQAVAFAVPHASLGEDVAAAVVLHAGHSTNEAELRQFARERLADFKIPSRLVVVDAIPKGPTGKVQRIGLHEKLAPLLHAAYAAPEGATEAALAVVWCELLARPQVGREDNFFLCGGDSLSAARLANRLRAAYGVELSLPRLFEQPTLAAQAAVVDELRRAAQSATMESLLEEIEQLSDEDAARLLAEERQFDS